MTDCSFHQTGPSSLNLDCPVPLDWSWWQVGTMTAGVILCFVLLCLWFFPVYRVWASRKRGQADLTEAQSEQQIQVARAKGRKDAANLNKEAAIIEAEAVAAQIERIGTELQQHDLYLRWQWIKMMEENEAYRETIYVPTEANLPVLEAGRLRAADKTQPN